MFSDQSLNQLAAQGFEAYNQQGPNPGLAHDGKPVPAWDEIAPEKRDQIHGKWKAAAGVIAFAVLDEVESLMRRGLTAKDAVEHAREMFDRFGNRPAITYTGDGA